jgi:hypothetical protein
MIGNVTALGKMGVKVKEGSDAVEQLRAKFKGFAESDAGTLTGKLDQVTNAWDDVKQAIGEAILGMSDVPGKTNAIRDALVNLKTYIEQNTDKWRQWGRNMLDADWGPIKVFNKIVDKINEAGLALYAMRTGDLGPLRAFRNRGAFDDVEGGGSTRGDTLPTVVVSAKGPPTDTGSGKKTKDVSVPHPDINFSTADKSRIDSLSKDPALKVGGVDLNATPVFGYVCAIIITQVVPGLLALKAFIKSTGVVGRVNLGRLHAEEFTPAVTQAAAGRFVHVEEIGLHVMDK